MKHKVNAKLVVKNVYSGGNFENGDIVTVYQIGNEDEPDCYGAISPHDGLLWFLYEDEVGPATNADRIRSMNDEELAEWLTYPVCKHADCALKCPVIPENKNFKCVQNILNWLRYPAEED